MVHFLGKTKPWGYTFDPKTKQISGSEQDAATHPNFLLNWWTLYSGDVVPMLHEEYGEQPFHSGCVEVSRQFATSHQILSLKQSCFLIFCIVTKEDSSS